MVQTPHRRVLLFALRRRGFRLLYRALVRGDIAALCVPQAHTMRTAALGVVRGALRQSFITKDRRCYAELGELDE